jgi:HEPN domain-containing protein
MNGHNKSEAERWWAFSLEDYAVAERVAMDYPCSGVWAYQQAAEKALKALLVRYVVEFPKTHDLVMLCEKIPHEQKGGDKLMRSAAILNSYGPSRRYPDDLVPIGQSEVIEAKEASAFVCSFVGHNLNQ